LNLEKSFSIGLFDSGVGGLSVLKELAALLPNEDFIYFGDRKNVPYGTKPADEVRKLSENIVNFLLSKKVKIIVVACNTATAFAINFLREKYKFIEFVGMEPAIKPAAETTKTGKIGVLATALTLRGNHFRNTKKKYASGIEVYSQEGNGLVEIVENNKIGTEESYNLLSKYLLPMKQSGIDKLVLGCTHYPFLLDDIKAVLKTDSIEVIDPAYAVARRTKDLLEKNDLLSENKNAGRITIFSNINDFKIFKNLCRLAAAPHYFSFQYVDF
jgi:glutamate racemase